MQTLLLISSILAYHYPSGLYRDTDRRYKRMKYYGKNFNYDIKNGINPLDKNPIFRFPLALVSFAVGVVLPLFCLRELFGLNWVLTIIINIAIYLTIGPLLAFITTPHMAIFSKNQLKQKALIFIIAGIILYAISRALN